MSFLIIEHDFAVAARLRATFRKHGIPDDLVVSRGDLPVVIEAGRAVVIAAALPAQGTLKVVRQVRARGGTVIVVSAVSDVRRRVEVLRSGADDHLTEPVDAGELVERIRAVRRRRELLSAAPVTGQIRFGGLRVEVEARDVFFDGERVSLSARELDLLVSLARAGGRVCSRAQLLAEVWGVQGLAGSGRLDFYIGSLRAKLGRPGFIQTVRGVGYRLGVLGDL